MTCSHTLAQQHAAMKAALVTLQNKIHGYDAQITALKQTSDDLASKVGIFDQQSQCLALFAAFSVSACVKVKKADSAAETHKEQAATAVLQCEKLETGCKQQHDQLRFALALLAVLTRR